MLEHVSGLPVADHGGKTNSVCTSWRRASCSSASAQGRHGGKEFIGKLSADRGSDLCGFPGLVRDGRDGPSTSPCNVSGIASGGRGPVSL